MSSVNDRIVRDYLEQLGFLVLQPRTHVPAGRVRRPEDEMDLLAFNPNARGPRPEDGRVWTGADLAAVPGLLVSVRGWHTERFSPSKMDLSPELFRFTGKAVVKRAQEILGGGPVACVLCVPGLPATPALREKALAEMRGRGVSGVLLFRTILRELAAGIDVNRNYDRSDLLQTLRILKNYGLLDDAQPGLFDRPRRRRRRAPPPPDRGEPKR